MNENFEPIRKVLADHLNPTQLVLKAPLSQLLAFFCPIEVTDDDLREYIANGTGQEVQPLVTFIQAALSAAADKITPTPVSEPETPERLEWVLGQLGIADSLEKIKSLLPEPEKPVIVDNDKKFRDWYTEDREAENNHYWQDYVRVLNNKGWDAAAIETVGEQAREVIRRIEDPCAEHYSSSRGLVVGYVQSGKTANFTAVAAKAIDAGYRLIIVLAGTLDNLRNQTQRRLDKELFGREAVLDGRDENELTSYDLKAETYFVNDAEWDLDWDDEGRGFIKHGDQQGNTGFPKIRRLTTSVNDYQGSRAGANAITVQRPHQDKEVHDPENLQNMGCMVAVVKKNAAVLAKLNADLKRAASSGGVISDLPTLVIDDESDQASINTKDNRKLSADDEKERTAVNREIVKLLENCPRAQYVGYTATPFANVFVDPSDPEDLYPRDFVLMLNEPPAYRGAKWFHDRLNFVEDPENATVENSQSAAFITPIREDADRTKEEYREELQEALDMFVLTGGIKKFREDKQRGLKFKHHTMLVHEKVHTRQHAETKNLLEELWTQRGYLVNRAWGPLKDLYSLRLAGVLSYDKYTDGYPVPETFDELKPYIKQAVAEMLDNTNTVGTTGGAPILQVDSDGNDSPSFEEGKVWKVLVGAAKLSRGYTVEGLTVSYFRRTTGAADTLMQTGRWFGFRAAYQDLVRLYAPDSLVEMFEAAMTDEENFRQEVKVYSEMSEDGAPLITPMRLAPLVHQSLPTLKPTSRNKMFNAEIADIASAPKVVELNVLPERREKKRLAENFTNVAVPLLRSLNAQTSELAYLRTEGYQKGEITVSAGTNEFHTGIIRASTFLDLVDKMNWNTSVAYRENQVEPRLRYMRRLVDNGKHSNPEDSMFDDVAVILPGMRKTGEGITLPGFDWKIPLIRRSRRPDRSDITGIDAKHAYVISNIARGNEPTELAPEDVEDLAGYPAVRGFEPVSESPFGGTYQQMRRRGAVELMLFDDRDPEKIKKMKAAGTYTEPDPAKGEVGVALAYNSPHALISQQSPCTWTVRVPGKQDQITVSESEVAEE